MQALEKQVHGCARGYSYTLLSKLTLPEEEEGGQEEVRASLSSMRPSLNSPLSQKTQLNKQT